MAKAMHYDVPPLAKPEAAREELDQLLENLHDTGILRFLNDFLNASPQVSEILLRGLNTEESRNAVQNLSLLLMSLGRVPPERFSAVTRALTDGLDDMEQAADDQKQEAPGVVGFYKLLHDEQLWQGLSPVIAGVKGFSRRLHEAPEKPAAKRNDGAGASS